MHFFPLSCHNDEINVQLHSVKGQCAQVKKALKRSCSIFIIGLPKELTRRIKNDPEVKDKPELNIFYYILQTVKDLHI